jgi:hypothetical protein
MFILQEIVLLMLNSSISPHEEEVLINFLDLDSMTVVDDRLLSQEVANFSRKQYLVRKPRFMNLSAVSVST